MVKPRNGKERQELVSSLGKAVSRFVERQTHDVATYSLTQAKEEKNQECIRLDKKLKIIKDLLITVQDPARRAKLLIDQNQAQHQKSEAFAYQAHLEQLIELKDKSQAGLIFLHEYFYFLRNFFESPLENSTINEGKIHSLMKKENEIVQSLKAGIDMVEKVENSEYYLKFIPFITKNLEDIFRDFSLTDHLSLSSQFFFLTGIYPLLKPYYHSLNYDQYDLKRIQYWLQNLWLNKLTPKEDGRLVGLLLLIVYKVVRAFFEYKPIGFQFDKLLNYAQLKDGFAVEEDSKNELYALKAKLKSTINDAAEVSRKKIDFFKKNRNKKLIFTREILAKINFIWGELTRLRKVYALDKQWLELKTILREEHLKSFLKAFYNETGIESYYIPDVNHMKSIVDTLVFCSATLKNTENKEKLASQLGELIASLPIADESVPQARNVESLTLKDFIYFGYAVSNATIYYQCQSAIYKFKQDLVRSEGEIINSIFLELLREIDSKKQKTEVIKNEFFKKKYANSRCFLAARNTVLDEVILLLNLIDKAIDILHDQSSEIFLERWQIKLDKLDESALNTEDTIFYPYWNESTRNLLALENCLEKEHAYFSQQHLLICQRVFILKEKEEFSPSSSAEGSQQKKVLPSMTYLDLLCTGQIFYQNLENSIAYIKKMASPNVTQRKKDQLLTRFSSALGQLVAHSPRLLKQLRRFELPPTLSDEMLTPLLRLERLKQFTERALTDPAYKAQNAEMSALIAVLNKNSQCVKQLLTFVNELTEKYRQINQKMQKILQEIGEELAHANQIWVKTTLEKIEKIFQPKREYNLLTRWLERLIKVVRPNHQEILIAFFQEVQTCHEYEELAWLLHQESAILFAEQSKKIVDPAPSVQQKQVCIFFAEQHKGINQNKEAGSLLPNRVGAVLKKEDKNNFTLWQIEFEQWRLNYSQSLLRLFSCIDQCFFSTAIQMKVVFLKILQRYALCLREKQKEFFSRQEQVATWLNQLGPDRPIYRCLQAQKNWLQDQIEWVEMYMYRLRQCEAVETDIVPRSLYPDEQLNTGFPSLVASAGHDLLSDYLKKVIDCDKNKIKIDYETQKLTDSIAEIMKSSLFDQEIDPLEGKMLGLFLEKVDQLNQLKDDYWKEYQNKIKIKNELIEKIGWRSFVLYASRVDPSEASCFMPPSSFDFSHVTMSYASLSPLFFLSCTVAVNEVHQDCAANAEDRPQPLTVCLGQSPF